MSLINQTRIASGLYYQSRKNSLLWKSYLSKLSEDSNPEVVQRVLSFGALSHAAKGIVFAELYGISRTLPVSPKARLCCTSVISLSSSVDDVIDQEIKSIQEKMQFCEGIFETIIGKNRYTGNTASQEAVLMLTRDLYKQIRDCPDVSIFYAVLSQLKKAVVANLHEKDAGKLLDLAREIGSNTAELVCIYGIVDKKSSPDIETPIRFYGEFGQIIDDLVDYKRDLAEGQNTFPTRCGLQYKEMKRIMLRESEKSFRKCLDNSRAEWRDYFRVFRKISLLVWKTPDWFIPKYQDS